MRLLIQAKDYQTSTPIPTNPKQHSSTMADNSNPGNFSNRPKEEVQNIASKGGQTGTENSGFASMPKEQVVSYTSTTMFDPRAQLTFLQQDIASQGGKASSGSFEKGSEKAKEAGKKGGLSS